MYDLPCRRGWNGTAEQPMNTTLTTTWLPAKSIPSNYCYLSLGFVYDNKFSLDTQFPGFATRPLHRSASRARPRPPRAATCCRRWCAKLGGYLALAPVDRKKCDPTQTGGSLPGVGGSEIFSLTLQVLMRERRARRAGLLWRPAARAGLGLVPPQAAAATVMYSV